jgi:hypothetical protein
VFTVFAGNGDTKKKTGPNNPNGNTIKACSANHLWKRICFPAKEASGKWEFGNETRSIAGHAPKLKRREFAT